MLEGQRNGVVEMKWLEWWKILTWLSNEVEKKYSVYHFFQSLNSVTICCLGVFLLATYVSYPGRSTVVDVSSPM